MCQVNPIVLWHPQVLSPPVRRRRLSKILTYRFWCVSVCVERPKVSLENKWG